MMKRIFSIIIIVATFLSSELIALSYSENLYYIDLPDTFSEQRSNLFVDENGNSITVYINPIKRLQEGVSEETKSIYDFDDPMNNIFPSAESIESEFGKIDNYEITTFTKNNYKCLHFRFSAVINNVSEYIDVYRTYTNNSVFNIFIGSSDETFAKSESIKNVLNSFTIKNDQGTDNLDSVEDLVPKLLQRSEPFYRNVIKFFIISILARKVLSILTVAIVLFVVKFRDGRNDQK